MKKQPTRIGNKPVKYIAVCQKGRSWVNGQRAPVTPILHLTSPCLQAAGFKLGQVVHIATQPGRLTITLSPQQSFAAVSKLLVAGTVEAI